MDEGTRRGGRFITLEGADGAGKSEQARRLAARLRASGSSVTLTREPGGTPLGERVRAVILDPDAERTPEADALLFNAARAELVAEVIRPALARGDTVVCDRFADSTIAYQGHGEGLDREQLRDVERLATGGLEPDVTVLVDVPPEVGLARRAGGDAAQLTRFETGARHDLAFHQRVRSGFLALAAAEPRRWRVVDGVGTPDEVEARIVAAMKDAVDHMSEPMSPLARMTR